MESKYKVTALKWRPKKFEDVVYQSHVTTTLANAIKTGRIAHAYLFTGPRGVGKTTVARIFARAVNCLNPQNGEPCDECENCKLALEGRGLDIIEIDGASNRGIDDMRNLQESARYTPTHGKYKIYIIDVTNRDGVQTANLGLAKIEKTMVNYYLNQMGIFQSEFGFPITSHEINYLNANLKLVKKKSAVVEKVKHFQSSTIRLQVRTVSILFAELASVKKVTKSMLLRKPYQ